MFALDQGESQQWRINTLDYSTMLPSDRFFPRMWLDGRRISLRETTGDPWTGAIAGLDLGDVNAGSIVLSNINDDLEGYIQDISVWNDILTDEQIKDLYRLPGYDSYGPGDLTRLKYVSADEDSNKLHAWWKFDALTSTTGASSHNILVLADSAPIGHDINLSSHDAQSSANPDYFPTVNTANFLPASFSLSSS